MNLHRRFKKALALLLVSCFCILLTTNIVSASEVTDRNYRNPNPPNVDIADTGQGLSLRGGEEYFWFNVCLDRDSFTDRGFSEDDLGSWPNQRSGVFLSLFNAVQANNPNDENHAWFDPNLHPWYRGISAHIDYWTKEHHGSNANVIMYAYDNNSADIGCRVTLRARNDGERPFSDREDDCNSASAIGCYHPGLDRNSIFVRADENWVTGLTTDQTTSGLHLTRTIAHEFGHFLGFGHVDTRKSIMHGTLRSREYQDWQSDSLVPDYALSLRF